MFMYAWRVFTEHDTLLERKEGKKKGSIDSLGVTILTGNSVEI